MIAGGNGMALGAVAAWFAIRRAEAQGAIDQEYDLIGVAVAAAVLLALPLFDSDRECLRRPRRRRGRRPRRARRRRRCATLEAERSDRCGAPRLGSERWLMQRRAARGGDRAAARRRALRRGGADRRQSRARSCSGCWSPRWPRAAGSASHTSRGAQGGNRSRPRRADRRGRLAARRGGEDGDDGWRRVGWALHEELKDPGDSEGED